jgi:hypothetical protein
MIGDARRPMALRVAAGLAFVAAAAVVVAAIPLARADSATDLRAISPFWLTAALNTLAGLSILAGRLGGRDAGPLVGFGAVCALLMGFWLMDGAIALGTHGPSAQVAVPLLIAGTVADVAAAALALAAGVPPRWPPRPRAQR